MLMLWAILSLCSLCEVNLANGEKFPPGVSNEWFLYHGRSKESFTAVAAGIDEFKVRSWLHAHPQDNLNMTAILGHEPIGMMDDVILTSKQIEVMLKDFDPQHQRRGKREVAELIHVNKWPSTTIKYQLESGTYIEEEVEVIRKGLEMWSDNTCLNFVHEEPDVGERYLYITNKGPGVTRSTCSSIIGMSNEVSQAQPIVLGKGCFLPKIGKVIHEFGHAVGLFHEHQRMDRNEYIEVFPDSIDAINLDNNYNILTTLDETWPSTPYDYTSVMHYGTQDFAKSPDGQYTVLPRNSPIHPNRRVRLTTSLGQRSEVSLLDAQKVNRMYCPDACASASIVCQHGGFPDPDVCIRCICSTLYEGRTCTKLKGGSPGCTPTSGVLPEPTNGQTVCMSTPNYKPKAPPTSDTSYVEGDSCTWMIKVPAGCRVHMWVVQDEVRPNVMKLARDLCAHYLAVWADGPDQDFPERLCGTKHDFTYTETSPLQSNASEIPLAFRTPTHTRKHRNARRLGIQFCYRIADVGCLTGGGDGRHANLTLSSISAAALIQSDSGQHSKGKNNAFLTSPTLSKSIIAALAIVTTMVASLSIAIAVEYRRKMKGNANDTEVIIANEVIPHNFTPDLEEVITKEIVLKQVNAQEVISQII